MCRWSRSRSRSSGAALVAWSAMALSCGGAVAAQDRQRIAVAFAFEDQDARSRIENAGEGLLAAAEEQRAREKVAALLQDQNLMQFWRFEALPVEPVAQHPCLQARVFAAAQRHWLALRLETASQTSDEWRVEYAQLEDDLPLGAQLVDRVLDLLQNELLVKDGARVQGALQALVRLNARQGAGAWSPDPAEPFAAVLPLAWTDFQGLVLSRLRLHFTSAALRGHSILVDAQCFCDQAAHPGPPPFPCLGARLVSWSIEPPLAPPAVSAGAFAPDVPLPVALDSLSLLNVMLVEKHPLGPGACGVAVAPLEVSGD